MDIGEEFLATMIRRARFYKDLGERTFAQLRDEDFHFEPVAGANSIATIIQHLSGNMLSRWTNFLEEDGEKEWRSRDAEFLSHNNSRVMLMDMWEKGWECYLNALQSLSKEDLVKTILIRKEGLTVIDAINRQLAHYPYHVGQIVYIGKIIKGGDWETLSIAPGGSDEYNNSGGIKDPAKKF